MATSKVEALKVEASGLQKGLVVTMDAHNTSKGKIKALTEQLDAEKLLVKQKDELLASTGQRMKAVVAKAVHAFQLTKEYNIILFQWYFKGFELLKRHLVKHGLGVDLEDLDFEIVDNEIEANEVAQAATTTGEVPLEADKDDAPLA